MRLRLGFDDGIFSSYGPGARGTALLWKAPWTLEAGTKMKDGDGRIAGAILKNENKRVAFVSAYAPNLDKGRPSRQAYVTWLISLKARIEDLYGGTGVDGTVVMGDFNQIVDEHLDSFSKNPVVHEIPLAELMELMGDLSITDGFRWFNSTRRDYTFKPGGKNVRGTFNRIDYIFASPTILSGAQMCTHETIGLTDHRAVVLQGGGRQEKKPKGLWRHNDSISYDESFLLEAKKMIAEVTAMDSGPQAKWEYLKFKLREVSRQVSMGKANTRRREKADLMKQLNTLDPENCGKEIAECQIKLDKIVSQELDTIKMLAGVRQVEEGEKCTAFFFACIRRRREQASIKCLEIEGEETQDLEKINKEIARFYENLYAARECTEKRDWYSRVPRLNPQQSEQINGPLRLHECERAIIKDMKEGKAPGNDGLTVTCYRALWPDIKEMVMASFEEAIRTGTMAPAQRQSVIRLIPKKINVRSRSKTGDQYLS